MIKGSEPIMDDESLASISSYFNIDETGFDDADIVLLATDAVFFYAHRSVLLRGSSNQFGHLITEDPDFQHVARSAIDVENSEWSSSDLEIVVTDYPSDLLDLVLAISYEIPLQPRTPSTDALQSIIPALADLGYNLKTTITPSCDLFMLLLQVAESNPLPIYAAAAQCSLESLAVATSRFTLFHPFEEFSDELAEQMGPIYLKRLCLLHLERDQELRRLVLPTLTLHTPGIPKGIKCNEELQILVKDTWKVASAYVVSQNGPSGLDDTISSFLTHLSCEICGKCLKERIEQTAEGWAHIKSTI